MDITKDAQQSTCEFDGKPVAPQLPGYRPDLSPTPEEYKQALELIHNSKRPVILAGHGIILSGAMDEVRTFAEKANIPVGLTLLGLGGIPGVSSAESRHDGHARRSLAEHHDSGSRFADRLRHAL